MVNYNRPQYLFWSTWQSFEPKLFGYGSLGVDFGHYQYSTFLSRHFVKRTLIKSSVIRQKGESQNGGNKKTNHAEFSKKRTFVTP